MSLGDNTRQAAPAFMSVLPPVLSFSICAGCVERKHCEGSTASCRTQVPVLIQALHRDSNCISNGVITLDEYL
jgi:hypothetical protein